MTKASAQLEVKKARRLSPEEKAALTCGRICGRSSLSQQSVLSDLGVPRDRSMHWTKYKASQEITKRLEKRRQKQRAKHDRYVPAISTTPLSASA